MEHTYVIEKFLLLKYFKFIHLYIRHCSEYRITAHTFDLLLTTKIYVNGDVENLISIKTIYY